MTKNNTILSSDSYERLLSGLKQRIKSVHIRAALAVNAELIALYWQIGKEIIAKQKEEGWGSKVIVQLSKDLKREFPDMSGFSQTNLKYMKTFAEAWPDWEFGQQLVDQIPWSHNMVILQQIKEPEVRIWYVKKTIENAWSRNVLVLQIESDLYGRQGGALSNFKQSLPPSQSDLAQQLVKDPYHLDFFTLKERAVERDLERALVTHIQEFLLELGVGFAFVGSQYRLEVGGEEFEIDMLFYHLQLRCYVVIDLKMGPFKPEYSGKMNFYINAVDDLVRHKDDKPTIGIILCKSKNKAIAEYSLRQTEAPLAIAPHKLPPPLKNKMPTPEDLEKEMDIAAGKLEEDNRPL
ncbi:MAG: PDDEXK nuclease domain-containing protein [Cyanobacteria bacterium J06649_4]